LSYFGSVRKRLGVQLVCLVVLVAVLAGGSVAAVVIGRARAELRDDILRTNRSAAEVAASITANHLADLEQSAATFAAHGAVRDAADIQDFAGLRTELARWVLEHPAGAVESLTLTDLDGTVRATSYSGTDAVGKLNLADSDWFRAVRRTGTPYLGVPGFSSITGRAHIPYGLLVRDRAGRPGAIMVVGISLAGLSDTITSAQLTADGQTVLIDDERGVILAHVDNRRILQPADEYADVVRRLRAGERGAIETASASGEASLVAFSPVPQSSWGLVVIRPSRVAFAPVEQMVHSAVLLVSAAVVVAGGIGVAVALHIARPLRRLRVAAEAMARGDLSRRASISRQDEIGQLASTFDHMADELQATVARLEDRTAQAEHLVEELRLQIAERQRAEEALRLRDRAIAAATSAILIAEATAPHHPILYVNAAFERLTGYSSDEVVGKSVALLDGPDTDRSALAELDHEVAQGRDCRVELLRYRKDGTSFWAELSVAPVLDAAGGINHHVRVMTDITARKEAEKQSAALARTEKLRALGQMASGIAHDLNQSLMLIASYGDLARRALDREPLDREDLRELFATATQAALDGGEIVKRLLVFARGPVEGDKRFVDLAGLVQDVAQLTAPRWRDAAQVEGRPITLEVATTGHPAISGSPARLREVLTNLVFNAVDALPTGGTIQLAASVQDSQAIIEVRDSGIGMPQEVQARIFEPFFTTKGDKGTGLGLAMVYGVVESHGGEIRVHSAPAKGTVFRMAFPIAEQPAARVQSAGSASPVDAAVQPLRILAVDDEPMITKALNRLLKPAGHRVTVANSGEEAVEWLQRESFDLVISDVGMGTGMNGWELCGHVRRAWPNTRLVLATGWGAAIDQAEARAKGVDAVLAKPFSAAELEQVLRAA